jgi:hypothetical protein
MPSLSSAQAQEQGGQEQQQTDSAAAAQKVQQRQLMQVAEGLNLWLLGLPHKM